MVMTFSFMLMLFMIVPGAALDAISTAGRSLLQNKKDNLKMRLSLQKRNVKNESLSGIFDTISIIAVSHMLSNKKKTLPAFCCEQGLLLHCCV